MPFLAWLARLFMLRRLFGGHSRHRSSRPTYFGSRRRHSRGYGRRRQSGFGLFGPVPYYSRQTRGGGRFSVGGCCLPIPLALSVALAGTLRVLISRR